MLLPDNLLNPISGPNPSGEYLRYKEVSKRDPTFLYDKIEEARREEEAVSEWQEAGKKADYDLVVKLATDALANRTKDIWIASRLTEALLRKHGFAGFREGLDLLRGLIENFWDTLYPELEDGDAELRAMPLEWIAARFGEALRQVPLTNPRPPLAKTGYNWFEWKQSTDVPTEREASEDDSKKAKRDQAIADKKVTPESFDEAFNSTKKALYKTWGEDLESAQASMGDLSGACSEKFGNAAPSFRNLESAFEEVKRGVRNLIKIKLERDPDEEQAVEEVAATEAQPAAEEGETAGVRAAPSRRKELSAEPVDREDALARVVGVARYLRQQEPASPVPYLVLRGLRWGELRASEGEINPLLCESPPTEIRQQIKRASLEGNWQEVLDAAETAMGMACGRAWLDLHRYVVRACSEQGSDYGAIAAAVRSELRTLLTDYPQLLDMTLMDDTPTANAETLAWLRQEIVPPPPPPSEADPEPEPENPQVEIAAMSAQEDATEEAEDGPPDAYEVATEAARRGHTQEAITILATATAQERSGRARFHRKVQLAGICMATGNEAIAYPILQELSNELERRKLEEWETPETIAQPLALLYKCLTKLDRDSDEKQKVYDRICRLDPARALNCIK